VGCGGFSSPREIMRVVFFVNTTAAVLFLFVLCLVIVELSQELMIGARDF